MTPGELILDELLAIVEQDRRFLEELLDAGLLDPPLERRYSADEAERARVARVLVRELDVNLAGVEVILHMREELLSLRRQVTEILARVRAASTTTHR